MTNTRPAFCITETIPTYCQFTDALKGSVTRIVEYCETEAFARKRARILSEIMQGESDFDVRRADADGRYRPVFEPLPAFGGDDEIPF